MPKIVTKEEILERFKKAHPNEEYGYDRFVYNGGNVKSWIFHKKCGKYYEQSPNNHTLGRGHELCSYKNRGIARANTEESIIERFKQIHTENEFGYKKSNIY